MAKELENVVAIDNEETKEENVKTEGVKTEGTEAKAEGTKTVEAKPEKEKFGAKAKKFGKKALHYGKKALPYVGTFVAGAGAAVGALLVMTRPDGTEVELIEKDDSMIDSDDFIEGEAEIVEETEAE